MFKKALKTSIELTRIGIDTMTNVIASVADPSPSDQPEEEEAQTSNAKKTTISGLKANLLRQANFKHEKIQLEKASKRTTVQKFHVPNLKFTAAGSNKIIELRKIQQSSVLFISHRENAKAAADLNWRLIKPYLNEHIPFFTANIILLNEFPAFTHPMVKRELRKSYNDIVKDYVKDRKLAEQIVHLLPDWKGASLKGFHIAGLRPVLASVILTPTGTVQNVIYSMNPLDAIRADLGL